MGRSTRSTRSAERAADGEVAAALTDGLDLVAFAGTTMINTAQTRKLAARVRQRGTVLLPLDTGIRP
ncbi:hypothetical protein [Allokutzneria albata]|uniref:hypothetical protein n=1 Tax=Allokutzneria albata TaxID=211114 RepID=UPI0012DC49F8|nr:hypothetical protein [Allokutzneria albata]